MNDSPLAYVARLFTELTQDATLTNKPISTDPATEHFRIYAARDPYLLLPKAIYFAGMGAAASYYPFIVLRLRSLGLHDSQAGLIMAVAHSSAMLITPLLSNFSDRSEMHRKCVLVGSFLVGMSAALIMSQCTTFWTAMIGASLVDMSGCCLFPIVDASLLALLQASRPGGDQSSYSESRAFGAAGWGIWAWCAGAIYDRIGLSWMFPVYALALVPGACVAYFLPVEKRSVSIPPKIETTTTTTPTPTSSSTKTNTSWLTPYYQVFTFDAIIFFIVVYITAILLCICDVYRSPYLSTLGASNELLGIAVTMTAVTEFPMFLFCGVILRRINNTPLILLSVLVAYFFRMLYYSALTDPWWTIPAELLHGITFAIGWSASTEYVSLLLPPELSSTAQGLLSSIQFGLASSTGALIGGLLMTNFGGRIMFKCAAGLALVGTAIMTYSMRRTRLRIKEAEKIKSSNTLIRLPMSPVEFHSFEEAIEDDELKDDEDEDEEEKEHDKNVIVALASEWEAKGRSDYSRKGEIV